MSHRRIDVRCNDSHETANDDAPSIFCPLLALILFYECCRIYRQNLVITESGLEILPMHPTDVVQHHTTVLARDFADLPIISDVNYRLQPGSVSLFDLEQFLSATLIETAAANGIELTIKVDPTSRPFRIDARRLRLLVVHALLHAIEQSRQRRSSVRLTISRDPMETNGPLFLHFQGVPEWDGAAERAAQTIGFPRGAVLRTRLVVSLGFARLMSARFSAVSTYSADQGWALVIPEHDQKLKSKSAANRQHLELLLETQDEKYLRALFKVILGDAHLLLCAMERTSCGGDAVGFAAATLAFHRVIARARADHLDRLALELHRRALEPSTDVTLIATSVLRVEFEAVRHELVKAMMRWSAAS